ncbi:sigma-70 family RNA polymerase sigma factor [Corynebacterium gerontici]|uniref:ECF RNA polymerase sigma-E factor n=1 Tax=Corynebacterium gerontici TaxID=2079234 RepID=A0A3G6J3Z8_9CORY|nr:sigma-70 family RNA polymerase sigma factor [Corynebacterium gerontici]AZA12423.1 ECF RNA polymerase sigma-E factor [Corynebacterium gerontici]
MHTVSQTAPSDHALVQDFRKGSGDAFEEILKRHHKRLWFLVKRYVHNHFDAEEVLQEALLKASIKMDTYRGDASLHTWLHRLVANTAYDYIHRNKEMPTIPLDTQMVHTHPTGWIMQDPCHQFTTTASVREAVESLPEDQRRAIYLVDFAGVEIAVAAAIEGVQVGTIKSRRARARASLKESLGADMCA